MELSEPKRKRRVRVEARAPLPINTDENGQLTIYTAHLSASGTCIVDPTEMEAVYSMGFFGKGSLSRGSPTFAGRTTAGGTPPIARKRQWIRRQRWLRELENLDRDADADEPPTELRTEETDETPSSDYRLVVLPDTDSDTENYLRNIKPTTEKQGFPIDETLHLTFEESFFLMYALGCLRLINYDGSDIGIVDAWKHFQLRDEYFVERYVVYHYFRGKGWVVKPGLKYGGDFLLYKQGPAFYHASYIVVVERVDADTLTRDDSKSSRKMSWKTLVGLERLSETIAKEILSAQILWPSSIGRNGDPVPVEALSEFAVRELLWRRWDPKRKRQMIFSEDREDDDSV